jgi:peptide chain release factor subunit 1
MRRTLCVLRADKYVFGVKDTLMCLDMGAVETLLVWESLDCDRYELNNTVTCRC